MTRVSQLAGAARIKARPRSRLSTFRPRWPRETEMTAWGSVDNRPLGDGAIHQILEEQRGHLVHKWRHYPDIYERVLAPYRDGFPLADGSERPLTFLEIGVFEGGSLEVWRRYFGPSATIVGVDIDPTCAYLVPPHVAEIRIGSQADPNFMRSVIADMGGIDTVLDDGSHNADHQRATFDTLWPLLSDGGLYLIEDTHTAYWPTYQGNLRRRGTAVEQAKDLVDDLHRWHYRERGKAHKGPTVEGVWSVCFYDSIIAIEKRLVEPPRRFTRGAQVRPRMADTKSTSQSRA